MFSLENKKALSNLITTVLIVMLTTLLIVTLGIQILKLINSPTLSPENSCAIIASKKLLQITKACYNQQTIETEITLIRNTNIMPVKSLRFLLDEESYFCNDCNTCQILNDGSQTYYFNKKAKEISIFVNDCLMEQKEIENC